MLKTCTLTKAEYITSWILSETKYSFEINIFIIKIELSLYRWTYFVTPDDGYMGWNILYWILYN